MRRMSVIKYPRRTNKHDYINLLKASTIRGLKSIEAVAKREYSVFHTQFDFLNANFFHFNANKNDIAIYAT